MGCFYSKDDFPTQEMMVAAAGTASGRPHKPGGLRKISVEGEGESTRTSSPADEIPRVVIHKDSVTAAQEAAAGAAGAQAVTAGLEARGESLQHEGGTARKSAAAHESHPGGEAERKPGDGTEGRATGKPDEKVEEEGSVVIVQGVPSEQLPRVVIHKDPEEATNAASEVATPAGNIGQLPARDPRPETPALPVSAAVGSKGLQQAAAELRAAVAEVEKKEEKNTLMATAEEERKTLAALPVSVVPIIADPSS